MGATGANIPRKETMELEVFPDVTLMLAKAFPHLQFVVQDRPKVITPTAIKVLLSVYINLCRQILTYMKFWKNEYPEAFESGRVKLLRKYYLEIKSSLRLLIRNS